MPATSGASGKGNANGSSPTRSTGASAPRCDEAESTGTEAAPAVAAIRLLMLTGCRLSEIMNLRWEDVALEASELRLPR